MFLLRFTTATPQQRRRAENAHLLKRLIVVGIATPQQHRSIAAKSRRKRQYYKDKKLNFSFFRIKRLTKNSRFAE